MRRQSGFTLVEVLIAVPAAASIAVGLFFLALSVGIYM